MKHLMKALPAPTDVEYNGETVQIMTFSVADVKALDKLGKEKGQGELDDQLDLIIETLKMGVVGASDMSREDFEAMPMNTLKDLTELVMETNGLGAVEGN